MSKEMIWGFYAVLIVVLGIVGYMLGKKHGKPEVYACGGLFLGLVISALLWVTVGKKSTIDY